jgi:hypothetical protein
MEWLAGGSISARESESLRQIAESQKERLMNGKATPNDIRVENGLEPRKDEVSNTRLMKIDKASSRFAVHFI